MCGIAGLIALDDRVAPSPDLLDEMMERISHRGPDGRGRWLGEGALLGHCRLSIVDPEGGKQPWKDANHSAVLVYNGEIYNHLFLRKQLESQGVRFHSKCDTELVYHALVQWGVERAVLRFRGMFSFGFWEPERRRLTLARDPMGVKPLYWAMRGGMVRFASEIKAILADRSFPKSPDMTALVNYLAHYRLSFRGRTFFRNIHEVPPGTWIRWDGKRREEKKYWRVPLVPEKEKEDPGEEQVVETFRNLLIQSVKRRLMADVPVGAYLSGGIDSSVIVTIMKSLGQSNLKTFSIGFEEEGYNEFQYASEVANALQLPHQKVALTEAGYFRELESLIRIKDTPLSVPNEVPLFFLSRVLKKNIKVVLSGEGADELLGGYSFLVRSPHDYLLSMALQEDSAAFTDSERERLQQALINMYGTSTFSSQLHQFLPLYNWLAREDRDALLAHFSEHAAVEEDIKSFWEEKWSEMEAHRLHPYEKVLHILEEIHLSSLLLRLDATTMAEGVEGRVPYTDRELIEYVTSLPYRYKLRYKTSDHEVKAGKMSAMEISGRMDITKYLLRLSFAGHIPDSVLARPKYAFPVPLDRWFFGSWNNWAKERILTAPMFDLFDRKTLESFISGHRGKDEGMKVWMLVNLGIWLNNYFL